jgi:hypothetical protein
METTQRIFVIGDIHGYYTKLIDLLHQANLIDEALSWSGGAATLWFMGDFCDRGPDGIAVLDLVMRLQQEAADAGGQVTSLLGNHEIALLSAHFLGEQPCKAPGGTFRASWLRNGGQEQDLSRLTEAHIEWMMHLPALVHVEDWLFLHADSTFYLEYGSSLNEVNAALSALLQRKQVEEWDKLLNDFSRRRELLDSRSDGSANVARILQSFGGQRLLHGHTCISTITRRPPEEVIEALVYTNGLCVNVDGGMYLGSPGFLFELPNVLSTPNVE